MQMKTEQLSSYFQIKIKGRPGLAVPAFNSSSLEAGQSDPSQSETRLVYRANVRLEGYTVTHCIKKSNRINEEIDNSSVFAFPEAFLLKRNRTK